MASFEDLFGPYSPKTKGDLMEYLIGQSGGHVDNIFRGPKYFFVLKEKGLLVPNESHLRVDRSPIPDICYLVNSDFMLESGGEGKENMSAIGAKKGVYNPKEALEGMNWSVYNLNNEILFGKP